MRCAVRGGFAFILVAEGVLGGRRKFSGGAGASSGEIWSIGLGWTVRVALLAGEDPRAG